MAVQTPIANTRHDIVTGSQREILAQFSSVANGDTWTTGLGVITEVNCTSGDATPKTIGATFSGGILTFNVVSGPSLNMSVSVMGF
jgi:hypothetical protein